MRNVCFAVFLTAFTTAAIQAAEPLSGDQIKQLLSGNTAYGEHPRKGWEFIRYFAADGKLTHYRDKGTNPEPIDGKWSIDGSNLCMGVGRTANKVCGTMVKSGEEYHFLKEHNKHILTFKKIVSGNPEKF